MWAGVSSISSLSLIHISSYSTSGELVRAFLAETYTLLKGQENFFHRMNPVSYTHLDVYKRQTIARALLRKPKVLILDDSTSAVDTATDAKIRKACLLYTSRCV